MWDVNHFLSNIVEFMNIKIGSLYNKNEKLKYSNTDCVK